MMTEVGLVCRRFMGISGEQLLYRWGNWGLSVVNGPMLHAYPFAREAAVIRYSGDGLDFELSYATELTSDVEVFASDAEANAFVERAKEYFSGLNSSESVALDEAHGTETTQRRESLDRVLASVKVKP